MYEILVNPGAHSGKGEELWRELEQIFKKHNAQYRVNFTNYFGDDDNVIPDLYEEYMAKGEELHLIVMGGDGTTNGTLQKLPGFANLKLSVIPVGSGNDLTRDIGNGATSAEMVERILTNPKVKQVDVGNIHCESNADGKEPVDRRFIVSTGIGFDAAICEEIMRSSAKNILNKLGLGKLVYVCVALKQLAGLKSVSSEMKLIDLDKTIKLNKLYFVAGMNHRFEGGGFMFGPEAKNDDGLLEICAVSGVKKPMVLKIIPTAYDGKQFLYDGVDHYRTGHYVIDASAPLWVHTDGEVITQADHIEVTVDKQVLTFVY